jgi:hypothetical protein
VKAVCETPSKRRNAMSTSSMWKVRATFFATILAVGSISSTLYAQAGGVARAAVPFPFVFGTQHYDAGIYTISVHSQHVILIHGDASSGFALTDAVYDRQPALKGKVVFRRYNHQYFLDEIWSPGMDSHLRCVKSKAQRKEDLASNSSVPTEVQVALLQTPR